MEDEKLDATGSEEIPDAFVCCVCLDLLYKPIVLHVSSYLQEKGKPNSRCIPSLGIGTNAKIVEDIGFDLCGDCYNTCSKRPGRFNQQHTPEHKYERIQSKIFSDRRIRIVTGQLEDGSTALFIASDDIENDDGSLAHILSAHNPREDDDNLSSSSVSNSSNINETGQDDSQSNI